MTKKSQRTRQRKTNKSYDQIEEIINQIRIEKQVYGKPLSKKNDAELFSIDTTKNVDRVVTRKIKPLRIDEILRPKSAINIPSVQRTKPIKAAKISKIRLVRDSISHAKKKQQQPPKKTFAQRMDIWDENPKEESKVNEIGNENIKTENPSKTLLFPNSFEKPNPEISYRPILSDRLNLIGKIMKKRLKEKESNLKRSTLLKVLKKREKLLAKGPVSPEELILFKQTLKKKKGSSEQEESVNFIRNPAIKRLHRFKKLKLKTRQINLKKNQSKERRKEGREKRRSENIELMNKEIKDKIAKQEGKKAKKAAKFINNQNKEKKTISSSIPILPPSKTTNNPPSKTTNNQPFTKAQISRNLTKSFLKLKPQGNIIHDKFKDLENRFSTIKKIPK